jgi:hypothetical protein
VKATCTPPHFCPPPVPIQKKGVYRRRRSRCLHRGHERHRHVDRKRKGVANGKCEGRKNMSEARAEVVALAKALRRKKPKGQDEPAGCVGRIGGAGLPE